MPTRNRLLEQAADLIAEARQKHDGTSDLDDLYNEVRGHILTRCGGMKKFTKKETTDWVPFELDGRTYRVYAPLPYHKPTGKRKFPVEHPWIYQKVKTRLSDCWREVRTFSGCSEKRWDALCAKVKELANA